MRSANPPPLPIKWTSALFARLQARYGTQWASAFPSEEMQLLAISEWSQVLAGLSGDDIKRGLDTYAGKYPPNAIEFRDACRPPKRVEAHKPYQGLDRPPTSREKAGEWLEVTRKQLTNGQLMPVRGGEGYITWANYHRRVIGMPPVKAVNQDGSLELVGP